MILFPQSYEFCIQFAWGPPHTQILVSKCYSLDYKTLDNIIHKTGLSVLSIYIRNIHRLSFYELRSKHFTHILPLLHSYVLLFVFVRILISIFMCFLFQTFQYNFFISHSYVCWFVFLRILFSIFLWLSNMHNIGLCFYESSSISLTFFSTSFVCFVICVCMNSFQYLYLLSLSNIWIQLLLVRPDMHHIWVPLILGDRDNRDTPVANPISWSNPD
jgi:hypothetical protein